MYLACNKLPPHKPTIEGTEALAEIYLLLDSLLFKLLTIPEKSCVDRIITLYHSSIFAGHQGVIKMYLTFNEKFFIPDLIQYQRDYFKECHICQIKRNEKSQP